MIWNGVLLCDLGEARTLDPLIKSQLLYQLSYQVVLWLQRNGFSPSFATTFINYLGIHLLALLFDNITANVLIIGHQFIDDSFRRELNDTVRNGIRQFVVT